VAPSAVSTLLSPARLKDFQQAVMPWLRVFMRWAMAAFYLVAGIVHLVAPDKFLPIVPDFVPLPREVVRATGMRLSIGNIAERAPAVRAHVGRSAVEEPDYRHRRLLRPRHRRPSRRAGRPASSPMKCGCAAWCSQTN
jgi:hypothetical protein